MTNYCCVNGPGGSVKEVVMNFLSRKIVVQCFLLTAGHCLEIQPILGLHANLYLSIEVNMTMQRPSDAGKRKFSLQDLGTRGEAMETTNNPKKTHQSLQT